MIELPNPANPASRGRPVARPEIRHWPGTGRNVSRYSAFLSGSWVSVILGETGAAVLAKVAAGSSAEIKPPAVIRMRMMGDIVALRLPNRRERNESLSHQRPRPVRLSVMLDGTPDYET
jgi:hypothetical protein